MRTTTLQRIALLAGAMLCWSLGAAVPAGAQEQPARPTYRESFERDFGGWTPDTDGRARGWLISRTSERAADGFFSLAYYLDGRDDDGTIWIERAFPVPAGAWLRVEVTFQLDGPAPDVTGWPVVAAISARNPKAEADLPIVGYAGRTPGWNRYGTKAHLLGPSTGMIWIAVGISATWETIRTHYVDLVEVTVTRA